MTQFFEMEQNVYKVFIGKKYNFKNFKAGFYASDKIINISAGIHATQINLYLFKS